MTSECASGGPLDETPLLRARGLALEYAGGKRAVDGLDLEIPPGVVFGLLGANGAGKTTTIKLMLGLLVPTSGGVEIAGVDVVRFPAAARRACAYVPEIVALYENFSGVENLRYFAALAEQPLTRDEAIGLLGLAGLGPDVAVQWTRRYSKGMRQKVGLAIALARRARVLLLDEPLSGLDPKAAHDFCDTLSGLVERHGLAVLMATHDIFRARRTCTQLGIMRDGRLIERISSAGLTAEELDAVYLRSVGEASA
jgi:ABC-2 type transport system ATP-binding protein